MFYRLVCDMNSIATTYVYTIYDIGKEPLLFLNKIVINIH